MTSLSRHLAPAAGAAGQAILIGAIAVVLVAPGSTSAAIVRSALTSHHLLAFCVIGAAASTRGWQHIDILLAGAFLFVLAAYQAQPAAPPWLLVEAAVLGATAVFILLRREVVRRRP